MSAVDRVELVAEPRRREILRLISDESLAVSDIAARLAISVSAVSQHLAKLHQAGLVTVHRQGKYRLYAADPDALSDLAPLLEAMWRIDLDRLAEQAETVGHHQHPRRRGTSR